MYWFYFKLPVWNFHQQLELIFSKKRKKEKKRKKRKVTVQLGNCAELFLVSGHNTRSKPTMTTVHEVLCFTKILNYFLLKHTKYLSKLHQIF
jgi:hypothetical protein